MQKELCTWCAKTFWNSISNFILLTFASRPMSKSGSLSAFVLLYLSCPSECALTFTFAMAKIKWALTSNTDGWLISGWSSICNILESLHQKRAINDASLDCTWVWSSSLASLAVSCCCATPAGWNRRVDSAWGILEYFLHALRCIIISIRSWMCES